MREEEEDEDGCRGDEGSSADQRFHTEKKKKKHLISTDACFRSTNHIQGWMEPCGRGLRTSGRGLRVSGRGLRVSGRGSGLVGGASGQVGGASGLVGGASGQVGVAPG